MRAYEQLGVHTDDNGTEVTACVNRSIVDTVLVDDDMADEVGEVVADGEEEDVDEWNEFDELTEEDWLEINAALEAMALEEDEEEEEDEAVLEDGN